MKRTEAVYLYNGESLTIAQLADRATNGISKQTLRYRLKNGMSPADAITRPLWEREEVSQYPCGAKTGLDCLHCTLSEMPCLKWPALQGEGANDYALGKCIQKEMERKTWRKQSR